MSYPVICLAGQGGVGKDHVADLIVKNTPKSCKIALADEIKDILQDIGISKKYLHGKSENRKAFIAKSNTKEFWDKIYGYAWDRNEMSFTSSCHYTEQYINLAVDKYNKTGCSARDLLQGLGGFIRESEVNFWVDAAYKKIQKDLFCKSDLIVVPDIRLRNELLFFKSINAKIFLIESPQGTSIEGKAAEDQSEKELTTIPRFWYNGVIVNDKTISKKALLAQLRSLNLIK